MHHTKSKYSLIDVSVSHTNITSAILKKSLNGLCFDSVNQKVSMKQVGD